MTGELVLLTGASGFVGFATLRETLKHGYKVRAVVRDEKKAETVRSNPTLKDISEDQLSFVVVPDLLTEGAFDEVVSDVDYILHIASPVPHPSISGDDDLTKVLVNPGVHATTGVFKSAHKFGKNVKRIVVTSSAAALVPISAFAGSDETWTPDNRIDPIPEPYHNNVQVAYGTSKTLALKAGEEFIATEKPSFDAIHIHPVVVVGRDERALTAKDLDSGSNHYALCNPLGVGNPEGFPVGVTHIDDVALAHVRALDPKIAGNQSFLLSNTGTEGWTWDDTKRYTAKHFPQAVESGLLPNNGHSAGGALTLDPSKTEEQLGIKAKSFEDMIVDLVGQYVELAEKEKSS